MADCHGSQDCDISEECAQPDGQLHSLPDPLRLVSVSIQWGRTIFTHVQGTRVAQLQKVERMIGADSLPISQEQIHEHLRPKHYGLCE